MRALSKHAPQRAVTRRYCLSSRPQMSGSQSTERYEAARIAGVRPAPLALIAKSNATNAASVPAITSTSTDVRRSVSSRGTQRRPDQRETQYAASDHHSSRDRLATGPPLTFAMAAMKGAKNAGISTAPENRLGKPSLRTRHARRRS